MQMCCLNKMRILIASDQNQQGSIVPSTYIIMCSPTPLKRGKWASARSLRQKKRADLTIIHLFRVICFVTNTNATETKRIFNQYNQLHLYMCRLGRHSHCAKLAKIQNNIFSPSHTAQIKFCIHFDSTNLEIICNMISRQALL